MKSILKQVLGVGLLAFAIAFIAVFLNGKADTSSPALVKAITISIVAFGGVVLLQAMFGMMRTNNTLMEKEKDWTDFWTADMFEYFYKSEEVIQDPWKIARGRYLLYLAIIVANAGVVAVIFYLLSFTQQ